MTSSSDEYRSFRACMTQKKIVVDNVLPERTWTLFDSGPNSVRCPLVMLPPVSGTADVFYKQLMGLSAVGYRVISMEFPTYWEDKEWFNGFRKLLDHLDIDKVHIFGASLGGYFAQKYAEFTALCPQVLSLILCNAFTDTTVFKHTHTSAFFWMIPSFMLKRMIMGNFLQGNSDEAIIESIDFMVDRLDGLSQEQLASRLRFNCRDSYVQPQKVNNIPVTIIDVFDGCALSETVQQNVYKCYPNAKRAHLKTGGNFPYLSRSNEVNVLIQIHLSKFENTMYSARGPRPDLDPEHDSSAASSSFDSSPFDSPQSVERDTPPIEDSAAIGPSHPLLNGGE